MLEYHPENRPTLEQILDNSCMSGFTVETELQNYIKPKVNILPEPFIKKYLVFRATKMQIKYEHYYADSTYMALCTATKKMVRIYNP